MRILSVLVCLLTVYSSFSQEETEVIEFCLEEASFPGGDEGLIKYLNKHIKYPERALRENIEGEVVIRFVVETNGKVNRVKMIKGIDNCQECNQEAIRLVKSMPDWHPYSIGGKLYPAGMSLPIVFTIQKDTRQ